MRPSREIADCRMLSLICLPPSAANPYRGGRVPAPGWRMSYQIPAAGATAAATLPPDLADIEGLKRGAPRGRAGRWRSPAGLPARRGRPAARCFQSIHSQALNGYEHLPFRERGISR